MPKTAYHSGIRNKHNCPRSDFNLGFLTLLYFFLYCLLLCWVLFLWHHTKGSAGENGSEMIPFVSSAAQNVNLVTGCTIEQVEEAVAVLHAHQAKEAAGVGKVE